MEKYNYFMALVFVLVGAGCGADEGLIGSENNGFDGEGGGVWSRVAPIGAGARQEVAVVAVGRSIYVLGGFDASLQIVPSVEVYDVDADAWRTAAPMPVRAHHANAAAVEGKIYVVGFLVERGFAPDGRVFVYDPAADGWSEGASMPTGTERGASGVAAIGSKVYVAGGLRGGAVADLSAYDVGEDRWESLAPMPSGVDHATAQAFGGRLYVFGGRFRSLGSHVARVQIYDPAADAWGEGSPMPTSRAGLASALLDGRVYVMGGEGNRSHPSGVFSDNEAYDPVSDRWEVVRPMLTRRHGTGAAAVGGRIWVPGGAAVEAFAAEAVHEVYTPEVVEAP